MEDLKKEGILTVGQLMAASENSVKRAMLSRILKKDLEHVLAHGRTAYQPPVRLWSNFNTSTGTGTSSATQQPTCLGE